MASNRSRQHLSTKKSNIFECFFRQRLESRSPVLAPVARPRRVRWHSPLGRRWRARPSAARPAPGCSYGRVVRPMTMTTTQRLVEVPAWETILPRQNQRWRRQRRRLWHDVSGRDIMCYRNTNLTVSGSGGSSLCGSGHWMKTWLKGQL